MILTVTQGSSVSHFIADELDKRPRQPKTVVIERQHALNQTLGVASLLGSNISSVSNRTNQLCRAVDGESAQTAWYVRRQPTENCRRSFGYTAMIVVGFRLDSPQRRFPTNDPLDSRNVHRFGCRGRCVTIESTTNGGGSSRRYGSLISAVA